MMKFSGHRMSHRCTGIRHTVLLWLLIFPTVLAADPMKRVDDSLDNALRMSGGVVDTALFVEFQTAFQSLSAEDRMLYSQRLCDRIRKEFDPARIDMLLHIADFSRIGIEDELIPLIPRVTSAGKKSMCAILTRAKDAEYASQFLFVLLFDANGEVRHSAALALAGIVRANPKIREHVAGVQRAIYPRLIAVFGKDTFGGRQVLLKVPVVDAVTLSEIQAAIVDHGFRDSFVIMRSN